MIVVDASAALAALLSAGPARAALSTQPTHCPHLVDAEVASGMRRLVAAGRVPPDAGLAALRTWGLVGVARYPMSGLLPRAWELRDNVSAYDAIYVALAEALGCPLMTADARLAPAPGVRCPVTVVPR